MRLAWNVPKTNAYLCGPIVKVRMGQKHNVMVGVRRINDILQALNIIHCIIDPHKFVQVYPVVLQYNGIRINGTNSSDRPPES